MLLCSFMGCWALEKPKPGGGQSTHLVTEAEVSSPFNQGAPRSHISLVSGQATLPTGTNSTSVSRETHDYYSTYSKNLFYLLNLTPADVAFPTSMISRFLTAALASAPTTCPRPHATTIVPTTASAGFHLHQCTDFAA